MTHILQIAGAAHPDVPCPQAGEFVESGDHDAETFWFTRDPRRAMQFATAGEAWEFWRRTSRRHPTRWTDGKPNRPLTAYTVVIETLAEALRVRGLTP